MHDTFRWVDSDNGKLSRILHLRLDRDSDLFLLELLLLGSMDRLASHIVNAIIVGSAVDPPPHGPCGVRVIASHIHPLHFHSLHRLPSFLVTKKNNKQYDTINLTTDKGRLVVT